MRNINVLVAGHQFADPGMWIIYLAHRFNKRTRREVLREPDGCIVVELKTKNYHMLTKAPHHALFDEEESYRLLLAQSADVVIYVQSIFVEQLHLIQRDFDLVSRLLAARPDCPPVFTLLNDSYCGQYQGTLLAEEELKHYIIPGSRVFRTAIGYRPTSGNCVTGADEVFDAVLNLAT